MSIILGAAFGASSTPWPALTLLGCTPLGERLCPQNNLWARTRRRLGPMCTHSQALRACAARQGWGHVHMQSTALSWLNTPRRAWVQGLHPDFSNGLCSEPRTPFFHASGRVAGPCRGHLPGGRAICPQPGAPPAIWAVAALMFVWLKVLFCALL
jgi:hypothetical protein